MPPTGGINHYPPIGGSYSAVTGRYMTIENAEESKNLSEISVFLIEKTIKSCCGEVEKISKTRDGKILVQTKSIRSAKNLLNLDQLGVCKVKVSEHRSLNKCRVVVSCREVLNESEEDIAEYLKPQGVTKVRRIMKKINDKLEKTAALELTMDSPNMPASIKIAYTQVPTRPYYPRPTRCFQCLKFGHISKMCKSEKRCFNCSQAFHGESCDNAPRCINCADKDQQQQQHRPVSYSCPLWKKENHIMKIRVDQNLPYRDARLAVEKTEKKIIIQRLLKKD